MYFLCCCVHTNDNNSAKLPEQTFVRVNIIASEPVKTCHVFHADIVKLSGGGSGLRLNDGFDVKLEIVG